MDFKHINDKVDKHKTPKSEVTIFSKRISQGVGSDSPFRNLPNFSTPPSRFTKIINPFEPHLIERLHLPTFSPNVFVQNSTPKTEQKFKWTIEDISCLKPADIDETTISQHVFTTDDPQIESLVQQKIETYFSEKEIAPSPINCKVNNVPLIKDCSIIEETPPKASTKQTCEGSTQTVLTLPPILPKELEEALKPYFNFNEEQLKSDESMKNTSLYRQLFEFEEDAYEGGTNSHDDLQSIVSSPALSTGLSPIQFSPCSKNLTNPFDMPELKGCNLSPISKSPPTKSRMSTSVCRLNFSERMSVDASMVVPDMDNQNMSNKSYCEHDISLSPARPTEISTQETTVNWSMEYKQVSLGSPTSSSDSDKMDVSNSNTPHSKLFIGKGQRKRLSESFKSEESEDKENMLHFEDISMQNRNKVFRNDMTDAGYHTQDTGDFSNNYSNVFASTPSKRKSRIEY